MKPFLIAMVIIGSAPSSVDAQLLLNETFDNWKTTSESSLNTSDSKVYERPGVEPENWYGANVNQFDLATSDKLCTKGIEGDNTYVVLANKKVSFLGIGATAPGFLSIGTPWIFAKSDMTSAAKMALGDGGTYGGRDFSYKPDAITFKYRKKAVDNEVSHVIAYLWNGTYKSNVPQNYGKTGGTTLKPVYGLTEWVSLDDVDRAVLGRETSDKVIQRGKLIASCDYEITTDATDWTLVTVPLKYEEANLSEIPSKMNVVASAGDYWNRSGLKIDSKLDVDDVQFVYYSQLATLTYDGETINGFSVNNYAKLDMSSVKYDALKLAYTSNGKGAKVISSFDMTTSLLTLIVEGGDVSLNPTNKHIYQVQFALDVTPIVSSYPGSLFVTVAEEPNPSIMKNIDIATGTNAGTVNFSIKDFEFTGIRLGDIDLVSIPVSLDNSMYTMATLESQTLELDVLGNGTFLPVVVNLTSATVNSNKELTASLDITVPSLSMQVAVEFYPYTVMGTLDLVVNGHLTVAGCPSMTLGTLLQEITVNSIDLSDATVDSDITLSQIVGLDSWEMSVAHENTLIYLPVNSTITGDNIIVGETAENIVITDTKPFNAPKAFTANSASYTRSCYIDGGWETIMLPFAPKNVATSGVTDDSYKLEKCSSKDNENVNFIAAEWEANTPYIFRVSDNTGAAGVQKEYVFSATNASVAATTEGSYTVNGFKGVYDNLTLAEAGAGYLLKADGESFALCAANSTVLPFRAYIPADGTTPNVLKVTRKDPTSIDSENVSNLIYAEGNAIVVKAAQAQTIVVNDLAGRTVRTLQAAEGTTTISGLASGFYIVNGQKILVK